MRHACLAGLLALVVAGGAAAETTLRSGPSRVSLLELYTSEGCSSCPPADQWLSGLRDDPRLWREVVPVAFHVDYWDRLGWPDRFADAAYTARQREHAHSLGMRTIYTPGLFLDGEEWRRWFGMRDLELDDADLAGELAAIADRGEVRVSYRPVGGESAALEVHVALLGFDLGTEVRRGENAGRRLQHDFVVLDHQRRPLSGDTGGTLQARLPLEREAAGAPRLGLAVWVSRLDAPAPLQAAGGWLEPPTTP